MRAWRWRTRPSSSLTMLNGEDDIEEAPSTWRILRSYTSITDIYATHFLSKMTKILGLNQIPPTISVPFFLFISNRVSRKVTKKWFELTAILSPSSASQQWQRRGQPSILTHTSFSRPVTHSITRTRQLTCWNINRIDQDQVTFNNCKILRIVTPYFSFRSSQSSFHSWRKFLLWGCQ